MNNTYRIHAFFAVSRAQEAVASWVLGVEKAKADHASASDIRFCEESLRVCRQNLENVRKDVKENWTAYL